MPSFAHLKASRSARRAPLVLCVAALALLLHPPRARTAPDPESGLVVEEVSADSPAARAGLRPGDRVLAWEALAPATAVSLDLARLPRAAGAWRHALEWRWAQCEYGERGGLRLWVWHAPAKPGAAARHEDVLLQGRDLGLRLRPELSPAALALLGREATLASAPRDADSWQALAAAEPDPGRAVWLALRLGEALGRGQQHERARSAFELALQRGRQSGDVLLASYAHDARGEWLTAREALVEAHDDFLAAFELFERAGPPSLSAAEEAADVGIVLFDRGELEQAREWSQRGWSLRHELAPESLAETASLTNLGAIEFRRGDLLQAERHLKQALAYAERQRDGAAHLAPLHLNLGASAYERADWDEAERHWQAGLALRRRLAPGSLGEARALNNLGRLALERGESERAADYLRQSLELRQARAPDSLDVARSLHNLADAADAAGDAAEAERLHRRALELRRKLAPASLDVAESLAPLALLVARRGELSEAQALAAEAVGLLDRRAPGSLQSAQALSYLARIAEQAGRFAEARRLHERALGLRRRLAPKSALEAESLHALARLARQEGREAQARAWLALALDALEGQAGRLGGADATRTAFAALHTGPYEELIDLLAEAGEGEAAFDVYERSRARAFLALVAARRTWGESALTPQEAQERRRLVRAYEEQRVKLSGVDARTPGAELQAALARLRELGAQREALAQRLRPGAARAAELFEPGTRRISDVLPLLDPGTLVVAYVVTPGHTWALAALAPEPATEARAAPEPVLVARIALGEAALGAKVGALRDLLQNADADADARAALDARLLELGEALLDPLGPLVRRSRRLLVLPDGPLQTLPFAALRCTLGDGGGPRALVEARALHSASSASVYAELLRRRHPRPIALVAFGRPLGGEASAPPRWLPWARWPRWGAVRDEVREIAALFEGAQVYLGAEASEARAKALGPETTHVHFAGHASADERLALDGHLELAPGPATAESAGQDGRLRAWEVMEELRLDADLVTLAACETGLGRDAAGEGLVGLVRAFQFAGARSLLASLWRVDDRSSAALMQAFYAGLRAGLPRDEALRRAQLELRARPEHAHPFHWAAFELIGDRN